MRQSRYFIRWDLPLAGLPYMLMMKGIEIHNNKKEAMNERLMAQMEAVYPI